MTVTDSFFAQVDAHGLTTVIGVLAVACTAVWCLLGIALHTADEYRTRRAERQAIADLNAEEAAWEAADIARGLAVAENYANHPHVRATWAHMPAPKEGGPA